MIVDQSFQGLYKQTCKRDRTIILDKMFLALFANWNGLDIENWMLADFHSTAKAPDWSEKLNKFVKDSDIAGAAS